MRALSALILSTALALPLASTAFAEDAVRSISVTGTGTIEAAPDMATLMIGVTTQGKTAAEALAENSKATDAVIARLTASGIAARDMQTSNLSINPNWTGYDSSAPTISGYVASNIRWWAMRADVACSARSNWSATRKPRPVFLPNSISAGGFRSSPGITA